MVVIEREEWDEPTVHLRHTEVGYQPQGRHEGNKLSYFADDVDGGKTCAQKSTITSVGQTASTTTPQHLPTVVEAKVNTPDVLFSRTLPAISTVSKAAS